MEQAGRNGFPIGEVARMLDIDAHTIRFWEKTFGLKVSRKDSKRRIYSLSDISLLKKIKKYRYSENMEIPGVLRRLKEEGLLEGNAAETAVGGIAAERETPPSGLAAPELPKRPPVPEAAQNPAAGGAAAAQAQTDSGTARPSVMPAGAVLPVVPPVSPPALPSRPRSGVVVVDEGLRESLRQLRDELAELRAHAEKT